MAQFSRQVSRPLSAASYKAAVRHLRKRIDRIEARCEPVTARDKASLTSAINGLSIAAQALSRRHHRSSVPVYGDA